MLATLIVAALSMVALEPPLATSCQEWIPAARAETGTAPLKVAAATQPGGMRPAPGGEETTDEGESGTLLWCLVTLTPARPVW